MTICVRTNVNDRPCAITDLRNALDPSSAARAVVNNNLALSDQIQFSQILRYLVVDSHQETLEAAEGPEDPLASGLPAQASIVGDGARRQNRPDKRIPLEDRDYRVRRVSDFDEFRENARVAIDSRETPADTPERPSFAFDQEAVTQASSPVHHETRNPGRDQPVVVQPNLTPTAINLVPSDVAQQLSGVGRAITAAGANTGRADGNPETDVPRTVPTATAQGANKLLSSALTDDGFSELPRDIYAATLGRDQRATPTGNTPSAASALKAHQQSDLAQRLGQAAPPMVEVKVTTETQPVKIGPSSNLAPGTQLAALGLDDGIDNSLLSGDNRPNPAPPGLTVADMAMSPMPAVGNRLPISRPRRRQVSILKTAH